MKLIAFVGVILAMGAAPALAAPSASADSSANCVDVQIGNDRTPYLNCLNDAFRRRVEREHAAPQPDAPVDARSPSTQVGTFNETAARQTMGDAFGVSATPQRPARVFVNPLPAPAPH
jgi:hypothetical protein